MGTTFRVFRVQVLFCALFIASVMPSVARAQTITVDIDELSEALDASRMDSSAVETLVLDRIQRRLDELDLELSDNGLVLRDEITNRVVEDGCVGTTIRQMTTEITLSGDTGISLTLESLFDPIGLSLAVVANIDARGRAQQVFGFRLGDCVELASDSFDFSAVGPLSILLDLSLELNPQFITENTLRLTPEVTITGELRESDITVDVDDSLLRSVLESFLQSEVDDLLSADGLRDQVAGLQDSLNDSLAQEDGSIDLELPPANDDQIAALYELLTPQARFPLTTEFLNSKRLEILAALIFSDQQRIEEILEDAAFCELTSTLQTDLQPRAIYQLANSACVVADTSTDGVRYSDASCTEAFDFFQTSFSDFCAVALDADRLGNAQSNSFELQQWTLSPATRFEIGALPVEGKAQPYVQRINYKNAAGNNGNCALEMRVYKDSPGSGDTGTGDKPLIALHGGSWQNRGTGFLGIENMATHFVDQGFVVFAPFYRLVSDSDGSPECHNATFEQLLSDVDDAFDWVQQNAINYGASGKPVVFGQSAGGHLAGYLSVTKPQQVERAVLFYPPTDFTDFASQIQSGEYTNQTGINIMQRVIGVPFDQVDLQSDLVVNNSFPTIVAAQPDSFPPMFLLHGESDSLLPFRQSVRLCNALAGDIENGPASLDLNTQSTRRTFACDDRGSQLHLIAEGEHALDLCISDELCAAGSPASAASTADSIQQTLDWSAASDLLAVNQVSDNGGGGAFGFWLLWIALPGLYVRAVNRY